MKKFMVFFIAAFMAVGFAGTAMAQTTVELSTATSGVSRVFWGPSFGTDTSGASLYVVSGTVNDDSPVTGATLIAVSNTLTNAAGTELRAQILNSGRWWRAGTTPIGGPQLVSGTTTTVILYTTSPFTGVGNTANAGNTLYAINGGTGATIWERGLPANNWTAVVAQYEGVFTGANRGGTPYSLAPVTIDAENIATTGATIYGISGASMAAVAGNAAGVSVWAINAQTGAIAANGTTHFGTAGGGVSAIHSAPVISGTSLFVIGYSSAYAGNTLYQFNKLNLTAGPTARANVNMAADLSDQWVPTPAVSGGSIFVVDNNGGVSVYRTDTLALQYRVDYARVATGVTAAPVTDGTYIVLCSTRGVTNYQLNTLSGNSRQWTYEFPANNEIWATPAISNGFVYVTSLDTVANSATTIRFDLSDTNDGNPTTVNAHGERVYASPIVVSDNVWTVTYNPLVEKTQDTGADGNPFWPQFKFDAAKTGANTAAVVPPTPDDDDDVPADDDSGCFISTIK